MHWYIKKSEHHVFCFVMSNFMKKQVARLVGLTTSLFHKIATPLNRTRANLFAQGCTPLRGVGRCSNDQFSFSFLIKTSKKNYSEMWKWNFPTHFHPLKGGGVNPCYASVYEIQPSIPQGVKTPIPRVGKDGGSHHRLTIPTKLECEWSSARVEVSAKAANSPSKRAKLDGSTLSAPRPRSLGHGPYSTYSHLVGSNSGIEQKLRLPRKVNFISLHARYSLTSLQ